MTGDDPNDQPSVPSSNSTGLPSGKLISQSSTGVVFEVFGQPEVLERHRLSASGHQYNPSKPKQKAFLQACRFFLGKEPFEGPLEVKLTFFFRRPLYHYGTGRNSKVVKSSADVWHTKHKDIDNLAKFVLDALNTVAYKDDQQVSVLSTAKMYTEGQERVKVSIKMLTNDDANDFLS